MPPIFRRDITRPSVRPGAAPVLGPRRPPQRIADFGLFLIDPDLGRHPIAVTHTPVETQRQEHFPTTVVLTDRFRERRRQSSAPESTVRAELRPGDRLNRFRIIERLGGGGMGVVYRAEDLELNRQVALKILPPHLCQLPDYLNRIRAEARAQARLNNPNVITLYSFLELPEGEVLVLEFVEGETLAERLRREGPLSISATLQIFEQALLGVEHIHRMGVVHRDLKPSNIFITRDDQVKLVDFGVAKLMDVPDHSPQGAMVGTLLYISPEQINGRETDYRSDVYTLGISLFEALTGRLPFERRTDYALMHAHVQETPPRPKQYDRRIPRALEWVILKAIEKSQERRFQSAAEFRVALLRLGLIERRHRLTRSSSASNDLPDPCAPPSELVGANTRSRRRLALGITVDLLLVGVALGLGLVLGMRPSAPPPEPTIPVASSPKPPAPALAATKPAVVRTPPAPRPIPAKHTSVAQPTADKYETLRQAWGD